MQHADYRQFDASGVIKELVFGDKVSFGSIGIKMAAVDECYRETENG